MAERMIEVTLCWSLGPRHVQELKLKVPEGSTVESALDLGVAQWLEASPAADPVSLSSLKFQQPGIWGRKVLWTQLVIADDRIELYMDEAVCTPALNNGRWTGSHPSGS